MPREIDLDALAKAAATGGHPRAPLVVWMCDHHDEFAAILSRNGVSWPSITAFFAKAGYAGAHGETLTPGTVRSCWSRARKIVARRRQAPSRPKEASARSMPETMDDPRFRFVRARDEHLWPDQPPSPEKSEKPQPINPFYAGLSDQEIVDKVLGKPIKKEPKK